MDDVDVHFGFRCRMKKESAAINGFGRFGLGLFSAWFNEPDSSYSVDFINDDSLTILQIADILRHDAVVDTFSNLPIVVEGDVIEILDANGNAQKIRVNTGSIHRAPWVGKPAIIFDCSSRAANYEGYSSLLREETRLVLIGATTDIASKTLIMGLNENEYNEEMCQIVSFGSCTVIPGTHLIEAVRAVSGLRSVCVNIVHSVPRWQLVNGLWTTISRKVCSLERTAPKLITGLMPESVKVNYTYAPYSGVSLMDFAITIERSLTSRALLDGLKNYVSSKNLSEIIAFSQEDEGAMKFLKSTHSISIIESSIDVREERAFFFGYFNNEGSGIRLHELCEHIVDKWRT